MMDNNVNPMDQYEPYLYWLDKKLGDSLTPMAILQRKTMNTVWEVLTRLQGIPFSKLSSSLYFFCTDVESREFTRLYEAQIELAGAAPEKFAKGLHKFFNEVSGKIKKNNLYEDYFDFVALCARMRLQVTDPRIDISVINCYYDLLLQNLEYLRPKKFDFSTFLCGKKTSGELMTTTDFFPNFDVPLYVIGIASRKQMIQSEEQLMAMVEKEYAKVGYSDIKTSEDTERVGLLGRVFVNQVAASLPFINEYTYDMVPKRALTPKEYPFMSIHVTTTVEALMEKLHRRNRTLPTNGVVFKFERNPLFREVHMKETFYDDRVYMLYRIDSVLGDLSGYYDTQDSFFFSIYLEAHDRDSYNRLKSLMLYLYACVVTKDGPKMQQEMAENCWYQEDEPWSPRFAIHADPYGLGGKLKNVFDSEEETEFHALRKGNEKYTEEERAIQGYIRKVGKGKNPSAEAVAYAESLGYELAPDETYVRPFIRRVLRLREAKNIENAK